MATVTTPERSNDGEADQRVFFRDIGWEGYATLLELRGERRYPRMVYLDGSVILVSPSYSHEILKMRFDRFVAAVLFGLKIPHRPAGSTTFRRQANEAGVEADQSYYLTNLDRIRGKGKISLRTDPPPDLAIEVVVSHDADEAIEVYRRFGVREVWICDSERLTILRLGADGCYAESERSLALPALAAVEIHSWVTRDEDEDDTAWMEELHRWVAEVLAPRHREMKRDAGV